jgi:hypothetical protein
MPFHIACPSCQQTLAVDGQDRGKIITCSQCGKKMRIPGKAAETFQPEVPAPRVFSQPEPEESSEERSAWDRPRRKRARYDDDDYSPAPKRKRGSSLGLWLGIGGGLTAVAAVAVVVVIFLLKQSRPGEPGRHFDRAGGFSYVPIPGWQMQDFPGSQFKILVGPIAPGFATNLNFVTENAAVPIADYTDANINTLRAMFQNFRLLEKKPFTTDHGLQGFKIIQENRQENKVMRQCPRNHHLTALCYVQPRILRKLRRFKKRSLSCRDL